MVIDSMNQASLESTRLAAYESESHKTVIVDNCAVDRLQNSGVNPVADFEKHGIPPDVYARSQAGSNKRALSASARTSQKARTLIEQILKNRETSSASSALARAHGLGFDQGVWIGKDQLDMIASVTCRSMLVACKKTN